VIKVQIRIEAYPKFKWKIPILSLTYHWEREHRLFPLPGSEYSQVQAPVPLYIIISLLKTGAVFVQFKFYHKWAFCMNKKEKEEILRERLTILVNCIEVAKFSVDSALNALASLDDLNDIIHHWSKYKDIFPNQSEVGQNTQPPLY